MWLWIKKLTKPKWWVTYGCGECEDHYCGSCGRAVQEGNYFWTKAGAIKAGEEWLRQVEDNTLTIRHTQEGDGVVISLHYMHEGVEQTSTLFATVSPRQGY